MNMNNVGLNTDATYVVFIMEEVEEDRSVQHNETASVKGRHAFFRLLDFIHNDGGLS
jgi:hypothetical protein